MAAHHHSLLEESPTLRRTSLPATPPRHWLSFDRLLAQTTGASHLTNQTTQISGLSNDARSGLRRLATVVALLIVVIAVPLSQALAAEAPQAPDRQALSKQEAEFKTADRD